MSCCNAIIAPGDRHEQDKCQKISGHVIFFGKFQFRCFIMHICHEVIHAGSHLDETKSWLLNYQVCIEKKYIYQR